jgi:Tfp pilus assembly protein PilF
MFGSRTARQLGLPLALFLYVHVSVAPVGAAAAAPPDLPALIKRATPAIVTVVVYDPDLALPSVGTGFLVAADRVVTARHVLAGADRAAVRTSTGRSIPIAGILAEQRSTDLVLVQLKRPVEGASVLAVAADVPEVGERLFTVSSPLGLEFSASDGIVSAYRDVPGAGVSMQHTVDVSAGSSGCPLLNERCEVVAVQTGVITIGEKLVHAGGGLNFAVSAKLIASLEPAAALRTLAECAGDLPPDWVPPITRGIDSISLHPLTRQDFRAALEFFRAATAEQPDEPDLWFRLGLCHEKLAEPREAIEAYGKAIALKPDFAVALNNLGTCLIGTGAPEKAVEALRKAVAAKPDYGPAYGNLAVACVRSKNWKDAAEAARSAVRLNPEDAEARLNLGIAAAELGDADEARRQYDALLKADEPRGQVLKATIDAKSAAAAAAAAPEPAAEPAAPPPAQP